MCMYVCVFVRVFFCFAVVKGLKFVVEMVQMVCRAVSFRDES